MRAKKDFRIVDGGQVIARRRTARELAGAIVIDVPVSLGTIGPNSSSEIFRAGEKVFINEPRLLCWVKKKLAEKSTRRGERLVDKKVAKIAARGLHRNPRYVKAA